MDSDPQLTALIRDLNQNVRAVLALHRPPAVESLCEAARRYRKSRRAMRRILQRHEIGGRIDGQRIMFRLTEVDRAMIREEIIDW